MFKFRPRWASTRLNKHLNLFLLSLALISLACGALPNLPLGAPNLSTDEGVARAYNRASGSDFVLDDFCISRPDQLKDVVVVGFFAHDIGCDYDEIFVRSTLGDISNMTQAGLEANGWDETAARTELALIWLEEVVLIESDVISRANEAFETGGKTFTIPESVLIDDGSVRVRMWLRAPSGMLAEDVYSKIQYDFSADGSTIERTKLDGFTIEY